MPYNARRFDFLKPFPTEEFFQTMLNKTNEYVENYCYVKTIESSIHFKSMGACNSGRDEKIHWCYFQCLRFYWKKHLAILLFLLFSDSDETYNNRLGKVKYLVDITMKEDPEDHLSLDESLMLRTGSLIIRQYIKNLRHMGEP